MWMRVFLYKYIQSKLLKIQKISILIMKNTECAMIFNTSRISSFLRTFIRYENFMYFISKHVGVTRAIIWATSSRSISNGREMTFAFSVFTCWAWRFEATHIFADAPEARAQSQIRPLSRLLYFWSSNWVAAWMVRDDTRTRQVAPYTRSNALLRRFQSPMSAMNGARNCVHCFERGALSAVGCAIGPRVVI